jgi:subfamily B ATP-binding cassette protein HlyB/CyaB
MSQLHRIPFSPELVLRQFPPPYNLVSLQHAAKALGLKVRLKSLSGSDLAAAALPCLAILKPTQPSETIPPQAVPGAATGQPLPHQFALVFRCDGERVLFLEEQRQEPVTATLQEFESRYAGAVMLFSAVAPALEGEDGATGRQAKFGFRWFIPELLKHKPIWRDVLLASLAIQVVALATPIFTQVVIDKVVVHQTVNTLIVIGVALAIILVFNAAMGWLRQYLVLHTGNRVDAVLGTQVFDQVLKLPLRYYEARSTGVTVARIHGVETIREFVSGAAVSLILDLPFLFIFLAIMFYYSWLLTLVTVAILTVIVAISAVITPVLRRRLNEQFLRGARNQAFLTEYISGMETVKSLQMEPQVKARFGDYFSSYLHAGFNTRQLANTYNVVASALEQLLTLIILCVGAWMVMGNDGFTIGMLVAFQMFAGRLSQPMLRLVGLWQEFQQAAIAVKRLGDIMDIPAEPYSAVPARERAERGEIEITNLSFRYGENLPYLYRDLNMKLRPGACIALIGPSGCGKSTLAKLLQGFYVPTDGQIKIDGRDIRHLSANELRLHFGMVPQDTILFSGPVYDNLIFANPLASFDEVVQACKMAGIHDTIEQLPEGYKSVIGEHGAGLSGGQKQRIAIARALLKRPKILIFDEATSNLDQDTVEQFTRTVNQFKGRVTMLFITHQIPKGLSVDEVVSLGSKFKTVSVVEAQPQSS